MKTVFKAALVLALCASAAVAQTPPSTDLLEVAFAPAGKAYRHLGGPGGYYPDSAGRSQTPGEAVVDCKVAEKGLLDNCRVVSESPRRRGFGDASLRMAQDRMVSAAPVNGVLPAVGERRRFIVRFLKPEKPRIGRGERRPAPLPTPPLAQRSAYDPATKVYEVAFGPVPARFEHLGGPGGYYPDRAALTGVGGQVILDCQLAEEGALDACLLVSEAPLDYGFASAAGRMATDRIIHAAPVEGVLPAPGERRLFVIRFPKPTKGLHPNYPND